MDSAVASKQHNIKGAGGPGREVTNQDILKPIFQKGILLFVIQNNSGKWQLLIDLRNVNFTMVPMNTLQPGLLDPKTICKD